MTTGDASCAARRLNKTPARRAKGGEPAASAYPWGEKPVKRGMCRSELLDSCPAREYQKPLTGTTLSVPSVFCAGRTLLQAAKMRPMPRFEGGEMSKRIMVDMSATLLHHGHVRLLRNAAAMGTVVVALTTDEEVEKTKGYKPELSYEHRKEILESLRYVDEVIPSPWLIDEEYMRKHNCDLLVHGSDNSNHISPEKLVIFPRTEGISSSALRERVLDCLVSMNINKPTSSSDKIARLLIETIKKEFRLD